MNQRVILRTMNEREVSRGLLVDPFLSWHFCDLLYEKCDFVGLERFWDLELEIIFERLAGLYGSR